MNEKRIPSDHYPTPTPLVDRGIMIALDRFSRCNNWLSVKPNRLTFLDPGCGPDARFAQHAVSLHVNEVVGVDINEPGKGKLPPQMYFETDYLKKKGRWYRPGYYDIICGNPPFSLAEKFVVTSLELVSPLGVVCLLLRLGFWASQKRFDFYENYPPAKTIVLAERPSFYSDTGMGKTDGTEYAFFLWDGAQVRKILNGMGVKPTIERISWRD